LVVTDLPPPGPDCAACAARDAVIAAQGEHLAAQQRQIEDLRQKVARLERAVSRNSGFSELQAISRAGGAVA
jgi:hypothetical protein